ncbi:prolyl oligopeptidase family serine peptidase [Aliidiomarina halalkaliphila]|uniref:Prolyl oligopeptidase family serine peptidase n=1 Tax=Aliidiomarina halalkaliphila TaxID=2593535 RepID=A0A552X353_9GAMM|nr:prolyl oligopeptidase family serine peptidase [Aliidiomarina halalkaliphila]TRW49405.1 prolyl oligopeptidase family serine peptidase [Aliidiomarina halalkaliphila]
MRTVIRQWSRWIGLAFCLPALAWANPVSIGYQEPANEIIDIVDAAPAPGANLSPGGEFLLILDFPALPTLRDLAAPEYRLAGRRINPANNTTSQARYISGFRLLATDDGSQRRIQGLPSDLRAIGVSWSPNGQSIAFVQMEDEQATLWHIDIAAGRAQQWSPLPLNNVWGTNLHWSSDSQSILVTLVNPERGDAPQRPAVPAAPVITETRGRTAPARTYQDLLADEHDEALFDYYFSSQVARIHRNGDVDMIGSPGVFNSVDLSPNDTYVLKTELQRPYSYAVPQFRFARTTRVVDLAGNTLYEVVDQPLADNLPIGFDAVVDSRRSISWRNDADATLVWAEAADGGDPRAESDVRDRLYQLAAPFADEPTHLLDLSYRYARLLAADGETALVWERWWADREERVWRISPDGDAEPQLVWERSWEDSYNDPGTPLTTRVDGRTVLLIDDEHIVLTGTGASDEGDRPFIDRRHLTSGDTERLWRSESPYFERPIAALDYASGRFLTQRESIDSPPDFYIRDLNDDRISALTSTPHPMPETLGISRELVHYEREDGLSMSATLFLPAGYDAERDGPLPTIIWAYPREFRSSAAAAQVSGSPYEFNRISYWRPQFLATQGYAVLDNATMPIVGEGDQLPNDTFIEQLIMNSQAAINAGVERGVTDPKRVALGGHSYGAFMTANVLAHSDLFQAGIARSGAYNRSLTPFGFQREERTIWDDPALYQRMSPFFSAHQIKTPLLLIHGAEDNNSGTFPMQSERMYQAIKGNGGITRLVMLPLESHGYRARESVLHMLWETVEWLDEFVKHADTDSNE